MMNTTERVSHAPPVPRQIILGCDGTNNTLTGKVHDTNVLKMIGLLVPESGERLIFYDPGVGSPDQVPPLDFVNALQRKWQRLAGLANGRGIYENIAETYMFLVEHYRQGDAIYLFGFSRGAFTARAVAGMVELFGIIRTDSRSLILTLIHVYFSTPSTHARSLWGFQKHAVDTVLRRCDDNERAAHQAGHWSPSTPDAAIRHYLRHTKPRRSTREEVAAQIRAQFASVDGATAVIHFIGVWDTVESVGIPGLARAIPSTGTVIDKHHMRHVRHALSMDEHRASFAPRLYWDPDYDIDQGDPAGRRSLKQRWFRGVHGDVGGGYPQREAGLSDQAFRWMLDEAIACGLAVDAGRVHASCRPMPLIAHDAGLAAPWWGVAGLAVRSNVAPRANGGVIALPVITAGAASHPDPHIYPVWRAVSKTTAICAGAMLACVAVLFCLHDWLAAAALAGHAGASTWSTVGHGALALELWQKSYFLDALTGGAPVGPALRPIAQALWPATLAVMVDTGLVVASSWLIGLSASWAFHVVAGQRNPADPVPRTARLGRAPMFFVLAALLENGLTLLTLWCIACGQIRVSYAVGAAMMIVGAIKWACLLDTAALLIVAIVKRKPAFRLAARTRAAGKRRGI